MTRPSRLALLGLIGAFVAAGCSREPKTASGGGEGGGRRGVAFPVEVMRASTRSVEYAITAVGSVDAFEMVQVTARVPGAVEKIHFREGNRVSEGDILVEIEPERYRLGVAEAEAAVEKAKTALAEAEAGVARREGANERASGVVPGEEVDAWKTRASAAKAEVAAQEATLLLAQRNARDARARAPFAGTVQTRSVQTGQYVQPGTLLTTLVRRDPLLLRFQVPDSDAGRISPGMTARFRIGAAERENRARIVHVAGSADPVSRMVAVTAEVSGGNASLRPGVFAEVTVPVGASKNAVVIPQTAVRPGERGFLAYVVEGGVARERVLTLGLRTSDGLIEVKAGLAAAESLVVRGAEALSDGAKVRIETAGRGGTRPDGASGARPSAGPK